jgi:hypothetical protein
VVLASFIDAPASISLWAGTRWNTSSRSSKDFRSRAPVTGNVDATSLDIIVG